MSTTITLTSFKTKLTNEQNVQSEGGIFDVFLKSDASGKVLQPVIMFSAFATPKIEISALVTCTSTARNTYRLQKKLNSTTTGLSKSNPSKVYQYGFDIIVKNPNDFTPTFSGTFSQKSVAEGKTVKQLKWTGEFKALHKQPLDALKQGIKGVPDFDELTELLDISPLRPKSDVRVHEVRDGMEELYRNILIRSLDEEGKDLFYGPGLKTSKIGSLYSRKFLGQQSLPLYLQPGNENTIHALCPQKILESSQIFLHRASICFILQALREASWLPLSYKSRISDASTTWIDEIQYLGPVLWDLDNESTPKDKAPEALKKWVLRKHYGNVLVRTYFAAYVAQRPQLQKYVKDPKTALDYFNKLKKAVNSNAFLSNVLNSVVARETEIAGTKVPPSIALGFLAEKLQILYLCAHWSNQFTGNLLGSVEDVVANIMKPIAKAAEEQKLVGQSKEVVDLATISAGFTNIAGKKLENILEFDIDINKDPQGYFMAKYLGVNKETKKVLDWMVGEPRKVGFVN